VYTLYVGYNYLLAILEREDTWSRSWSLSPEPCYLAPSHTFIFVMLYFLFIVNATHTLCMKYIFNALLLKGHTPKICIDYIRRQQFSDNRKYDCIISYSF
jgi:hypothetical protein